jgi:hypothetical protein
MWCYLSVVRTPVGSTTLRAASHPLGLTRKFAEPNHCPASAIPTLHSLVCHTCKNKGLCSPHIFQSYAGIRLSVKQVPA